MENRCWTTGGRRPFLDEWRPVDLRPSGDGVQRVCRVWGTGPVQRLRATDAVARLTAPRAGRSGARPHPRGARHRDGTGEAGREDPHLFDVLAGPASMGTFVMWGTDMTSVTVGEGAACVFVAVDHCTTDRACGQAWTRFEALEPIRQGVRERFGIGDGVARGLRLRQPRLELPG